MRLELTANPQGNRICHCTQPPDPAGLVSCRMRSTTSCPLYWSPFLSAFCVHPAQRTLSPSRKQRISTDGPKWSIIGRAGVPCWSDMTSPNQLLAGQHFAPCFFQTGHSRRPFVLQHCYLKGGVITLALNANESARLVKAGCGTNFLALGTGLGICLECGV